MKCRGGGLEVIPGWEMTVLCTIATIATILLDTAVMATYSDGCLVGPCERFEKERGFPHALK